MKAKPYRRSTRQRELARIKRTHIRLIILSMAVFAILMIWN